MSSHRADRIAKPPYFRIAHLTQGRSRNRRPYVIGFDSEAHSCQFAHHARCEENGYPFLYQFAHPDGRCDLVVVPRTGRKFETFFAFVEQLHKICRDKEREYIVFGYNLSYEYTQLFRDLDDSLKEASEFGLGIKPNEPCRLPDGTTFYVVAMNVKRYSFTIEWGGTKRRTKVIDAMAFVGGGLDAASKMLGIGRKRNKPKHFDRDNALAPDMVDYATQDAILTQRLGEWVIDIHERYDVTQCVSAPHFASKVFKRAYLSEQIPLASGDLEEAGLRSYHGGKNGFYNEKPMERKGIWHVDIRSAYPEAMRQLPDPERSEWLYSTEYVPGAHAIWHVRGRYRRCKYRSLMADNYWPQSGRLAATVTSYELDSALAHGEIALTSCEGWMMVGPEGGALVSYVDDFYKMKRYAETDAERLAAKLLLNSMYGKFFQKVPQGNVGSVDLETEQVITTDPTIEYDYIAGGLYHPPIASLITGYVRAKIHTLEHRFRSIMTSTDGFFCYERPPVEMLGKELGMLSAERGKLRILRERVYVFDPDEPEHTDDCEPGCRDPHPIYAMHGFIGTVGDLRRVPLTPGNHWHYIAQRMVTLRMSLNRIGGERYAPGEFVQTERTLILPGSAALPP